MRTVSVLLVGTVLVACADRGVVGEHGPQGPVDFNLYVVNISEVNRIVDLAVYLDDAMVFRQDVSTLPVGVLPGTDVGELTPKALVLRLTPGTHTVRVVAAGGRAFASATFTATAAPLWCRVLYDYSPGGDEGVEIPEKVVIRIENEAPRWV